MRRLLHQLCTAALLVCVCAWPAGAQTTALKGVMRAKLAHAQALLGALVTSNWPALEEHAIGLRKTTDDPAWAVLMSAEYVRQTNRFVRAVEDLVDAARRQDLDESPAAYSAMTMSCVSCHRYVARSRIAAGPGATP
ncbi:MAG: hypothetical protein FJW23_12445 [Acidimicrobiia bacterium]|nr:hypothetical protein [Acidimicrobiia bacterium]